jgi:hypothetical protein
MITLDEILINIFSFCDRSCLYPLILSSKHIGTIAKLIILSPNLIVELTLTSKYKTTNKEYRVISWRDYINYKRGFLYTDHKMYTYHNSHVHLHIIRKATDTIINKFFDIVSDKFIDFNEFDYIFPCTYTYIIEDGEPEIVKYIEIIENIIRVNNSCYRGIIDKNIKLIPRDILDYLDRDCPNSVKYLIEKYNFEVTKESILKAHMSHCYQNLNIYIYYHDKFKDSFDKIEDESIKKLITF